MSDDMAPEEKLRLGKVEFITEKIQKDVEIIKGALLGNQLSGDKGLKGRIDVLTAKQEILEGQLKEISEERVKNSVYIKIINRLLLVIGTGVVGIAFDILLKKF